MKLSRPLFTAAALVATLWLTMIGCEYNVAEPVWDQPYTAPGSPTITQVAPAAAPAGVNAIVISGTLFDGVPDTNGVFFNSTAVEIIEKTPTSIKVRRPGVPMDTCTVKVVSHDALIVAKHSFGAVASVMERFGSFRDNIALSTVAVDSAENLFVVSGASGAMWRITPNADKSLINLTIVSPAVWRVPSDARIRAGALYLMGNNREVQQVNLATGQDIRWTRMPVGKAVRFGDFDANGYFYTGGANSDLCIVPPNPPVALLAVPVAGEYGAEDILAVRVVGGYVYVASRTSAAAPAKVYRHAIRTDTLGLVGTRQLVLDMSTFGAFSSRTVTGIAPGADGAIYITTDATDPLLVFRPADNSMDMFYKNIVPPKGKHSVWGSGNYLYMISGDILNSDTALRWNVAKIDMGTTKAN